MSFTESVVEDDSLAWLEALGYAVLHGPDIAAGEPGVEKTDILSVGECSCAVHQCPHHVHQILMERE